MADNDEALYLNKAQFARSWQVSPRQVGFWIGEGMPCEGGGKRGARMRIYTPDANTWVKNYYVGANTPGGGGRAALIEEQRRRLWLENEESEGRLVDVEEVRQFMTERATVYSSQIDALAGRLAQGDSESRERIFDECRRIRANTAEAILAHAHRLAGGRTGKAPAETASVGVGGGKKKPAKGKRGARTVQ